jgi:5-methyltetrahydropteroyltriglutamate--homocysteine methyltransferase
MVQGLLTTSVGSFPKPAYLLEARNRFAKGAITEQELNDLEKQATREWIEFQEELGVDILVDGEMYRGDMATYFAERLDGFSISGLVRSYGNRYYRKPVAVAEIRWREPISVSMFNYAQSLTDKPVKGMLTGPYTMMDWSFNEHYPNREALAMALAEAIHQEAVELEKAGAQYIQIDEPAVSTRPEELEIAIKAMAVVTNGLHAHTLTHICYGDFEKIYPRMLDIPVDQIDLEMANSHYDLLDTFRKAPFTKAIGLGVVDVHSHVMESVDEVADGIRRTLAVIPSAQIYVDPDCGLKTRTVEEAKEKMRIVVEATRRVKAELQL